MPPAVQDARPAAVAMADVKSAVRVPATPWDGRTFEIRFGTDGDVTATEGFHKPESVIQIAASSPSYVLFPYFVQGPINVTVMGWMPPAIAGQGPVTFTVGGSSAKIQFTGENAAQTFQLNPQVADDRMKIESDLDLNAIRDGRPIGLAVSYASVAKR